MSAAMTAPSHEKPLYRQPSATSSPFPQSPPGESLEQKTGQWVSRRRTFAQNSEAAALRGTLAVAGPWAGFTEDTRVSARPVVLVLWRRWGFCFHSWGPGD